MEQKLAKQPQAPLLHFIWEAIAVKNPQLGENKACAAGERVII